MELKPAYVDVEFASDIAQEVIELARENGVGGVVLSHHNFNGTPDFGKLLTLLEEMEELEPEIIKIVTTANSPPSTT